MLGGLGNQWWPRETYPRINIKVIALDDRQGLESVNILENGPDGLSLGHPLRWNLQDKVGQHSKVERCNQTTAISLRSEHRLVELVIYLFVQGGWIDQGTILNPL